jgi:hypothetical protein
MTEQEQEDILKRLKAIEDRLEDIELDVDTISKNLSCN